jgi:hypothetical protein
MFRLAATMLIGMSLAAPVAMAGDTPSPENAYLYVGWPNDGEVLGQRPFRVWFGLRHMGVCPAGVDKPNTGHHHLLIDTEFTDPDQPIPSDRNHLHFGAGQTETTIQLPPGTHTLQLVMGDANHIPHDPPVVSRVVTITVR